MVRLKKYIFILLFLCCASLGLYAQGGRQPVMRKGNDLHRTNARPSREVIKRGYISQQLSLTPEQTSKFWPVYNQYQQELDQIYKLRRANNASMQANGTDQFDRELEYQQKITATQKHYYNEFLKILPPDKAAQVFKSERDFKFELLRRLKEGRQAVD